MKMILMFGYDVFRKNLGDYISNEIIDEDKKGFAGIPMSVKNGATELLRRNGTTPPSSNSSVVSVSSNGNSYSNAVPVNSTRRVTVVNAAIPVSSGGSSSGSNSNSSSPESNSRSEPSTRSAPSPPVSECSPKSESSSPRAESSSSKRPSDSPDEVAVRPPTRRRLNGYIVRSPPVVVSGFRKNIFPSLGPGHTVGHKLWDRYYKASNERIFNFFFSP